MAVDPILKRRAIHWCGLYFVGIYLLCMVILVGLLLLTWLEIIKPARRTFAEGQYVWSGILTIIALIPYSYIFLSWKRGLFTKRDFIEILDKGGWKVLRKSFRPPGKWWFTDNSFLDAVKNDIYLIAELDSSSRMFTTYHPIKDRRTANARWFNPSYMAEASKIDIFCLISGPYQINQIIKVSKNVEIPLINTNCQEINSVVSAALKKFDELNMRVIFNQNWLRITIIGGSWLGDRFRKNILNSLEVFEELKQRLSTQYKIKGFEEWKLLWSPEQNDFVLAKREKV